MKAKWILGFAALLGIGILVGALGFSQSVPQLINYQGRLQTAGSRDYYRVPMQPLKAVGVGFEQAQVQNDNSVKEVPLLPGFFDGSC